MVNREYARTIFWVSSDLLKMVQVVGLKYICLEMAWNYTGDR